MVATPGLLLDQVPPAEESVHVAVLPRQISAIPTGDAGSVLTVIVFCR